jgi:hypothetical protein
MKNEDKPFASEIVYNYVMRTADMALFQGYSPTDYSTLKLADWAAKIAAGKAIVLPKNYTNQMNQFKATTHENMENCRPMLDKLEERATAAYKVAPLTVTVRNFGIHEVRECINHDGYDAFSLAFTNLQKNVTDNITALNAKDYTSADNLVLTGFAGAAGTAANNATTMKATRDEAVSDNFELMNELGELATNACAVGQSIFKAPLVQFKLDEYIMANVAIILHPTPPIKPINKTVAHNGNRCIFVRLEKGERIRVKLLTIGASASICRQVDPKHIVTCVGGLALVYNVAQTLLATDIPGTGEGIVLTNPTDTEIIVEVLRIPA